MLGERIGTRPETYTLQHSVGSSQSSGKAIPPMVRTEAEEALDGSQEAVLESMALGRWDVSSWKTYLASTTPTETLGVVVLMTVGWGRVRNACQWLFRV